MHYAMMNERVYIPARILHDQYEYYARIQAGYIQGAEDILVPCPACKYVKDVVEEINSKLKGSRKITLCRVCPVADLCERATDIDTYDVPIDYRIEESEDILSDLWDLYEKALQLEELEVHPESMDLYALLANLPQVPESAQVVNWLGSDWTNISTCFQRGSIVETVRLTRKQVQQLRYKNLLQPEVIIQRRKK
jgi:hypothetical protein